MPWSISGDDIAEWADRIEAAHGLHALVRRLLLATVPMPQLSLRADGGMRLEGPDALVVSRAEAGGPYCPDGRSLWELSVRASARTKLKEDYDKRPPVGVNPRTTTYVAVTARRLAEAKNTWVQDRRDEGLWADVRLLDADDLSGWLDIAPAVAFWFAETALQRPVQDMRTVDDLLLEFSNRTRPPLPPSVALAGKDRTFAAQELLRALMQNEHALQGTRPRERRVLPPLIVGAKTAEEALVFVAATLAQPDNQDAESLKARAVIVDSLDAFRFCLRAQSKEPLVILPKFEDVPAAQAAGYPVHLVLPSVAKNSRRGGGVVELPTLAGNVVRRREDIALGAIPFKPLARELDKAGIKDAERLARESEGRLVNLQRLLGHVDLLPRAPAGSTSDVLSALLLAGAWTPGRETDREMLRRLGADPVEAERQCTWLSQGEDPQFEAVRDHGRELVFRWVSPRDAFRRLAKNLTEAHLRGFRDVAFEVLSPPPPAPDDAPEDLHAQVRLQIERQQAACSETLFKGIAASIAWLAVEDAALAPYLAGRGRGLAEDLVRWLLVPEARAWSFLASVLQDLAEAAPRVFLDRLGEALDRGKDGIARSDQLLWAVETLAWDRSLLLRVTEALAQLVPYYDDLPKNFSHRPINSLRGALHWGLPQSQSTVQDRVGALRNLFEKYDEIAWKVSVDLFQGLSGLHMISPSPRPRYWLTPELPAELHAVTYDELDAQAEAMLVLMLERAEDKAERWASLVSTSLDLGALGLRMLDALEAVRPRIEDAGAQIWNAIRELLGLFRDEEDEDEEASSTHDQEDSGEDERERKEYVRTLRARLGVFYESEAFQPKDIALKYAWLFDFDPRLPKPVAKSDWKANEAHVDELRQDAVEALRELPDRGEVLGRLAAQVKAPHFLARALAQAKWAEEIESMLLADPPATNLGLVEPLFVASRNHVCGWDWAERFIETIVRRNQMDRALEILLPFIGSGPWNLVDKIGDPLRASYWQKVQPWYGPLPAEDWERGIACLLDAGRPTAALRAAQFAVEKNMIARPTIVRVLEATAAEDANTREHLVSAVMVPRETEIELMFQALDRDPAVDPEVIVRLEMLHAESLTSTPSQAKHRRGARRFYEKVSASPEYFVDVLRRLVPPKGQSSIDMAFREPADEVGIERRRLLTLLFHWPGYPGEGLPVTERDTVLDRWCGDVLQRSASGLAVDMVARVLSRVESYEDGHWPCLTACRLIESGKYPDLSRDLSLAKSNGRGMHLVSSEIERKIARGYQASADALRAASPKTAAMLEAMAAGHYREAEVIEPEEKRRHFEYGEDEPRSRPSPPPPADPPAGSMPFTLHIQNLRALRSFRFSPPAGVSCLVGPNGSGKTTFLLALKMLRHALSREDLGAAALATIGSSRLRNARATSNEPTQLSVSAGDVQWTLQLVEQGGGLEPLAPETVTLAGETLLRRSAGARAVWYRGAQLPQPDDDRLALRYALERVDDEPLRALRAWFEGLSVLHDVDLHDLRVHGSRAGLDRQLESRGSNVFAMLRRWYERREDRFRFEMVRRGLREAFPDICADLDFESNAQTVMLRTYRPYEEQALPASVEANGLLSMTASLTALAAAPRGGMVVLDEPETALHPHAIHALVDGARAWSGQQGLTVLLLTHSPLVLDAFHEDRARVFVLEPGEQKQPVSLAEHADHEWMAHFSPGKLYGQEEVAAPPGSVKG